MPKKRVFKILKWFFGIIASFFLLISLLLYIFKDDICQMAISEVNKHLKAKVTVSEVDITFWSTFPNLSIDFNHVYIMDARPNATSRDTLLYTDMIRCKVNPFDVWREEYKVKSLEIHPGVLNLRVDSAGNNNYDIFKEPENPSDGSFEMQLKEVVLNDFRFNYINDATSQVYKTHIRSMRLDGDLSKDVFTTTATSDLRIIAAKSGNITLVSNKPAKLGIRVEVDTKKGTVVIPKSTISVANLPFNFEGKVDTTGFHFGVTGKNIGIEEAANNLAFEETKQIKSFSGKGTLLFDLQIDGKNEATTPAEVVCTFGVDNGNLRDPNSNISLKNLTLKGAYSNVGGAKKEYLELKDVGFVTTGGPFKGRLKITKFNAPLFEGNAVGLINLAVVRSLFKLTQFEQLRGTVDVTSNFAVQTEVLADESKSYHINKCEGEVKMNKIRAQLVDDKRVYREIEGRVFLRNDKVGMDAVTLMIGSSDFKVDGVFSDVVDYFSKRGSLNADVEIVSSRIDMADLGSNAKADKLLLDRAFIMPDDVQGKVYVDVANLKYEKHYFRKLRGNMTLRDRVIDFPKLTVSNGGADASGTLTISEKLPEIFTIKSHIVSNNIAFDQMFQEWDDFKQDVIKSSNITGVAKANIEFEAPFDLRTGIISKAIVAKIGIEIDNGRLKNVGAFKEITQSLNEMASARLAIGKENIKAFESKLLDLKFDHLENTLLIRDGVIVIPSMSIKSSALELEVSGKHTFDDKIDYRFGFRFRDLKQAEVSEFGRILDDGTGKHVFMRMFGDLYNPSFEWDVESSKAHKKEEREVAKQDARSIFKSEFGLFKNDTTVKAYVKERRPTEELELILNPTEENDVFIEQSKPKKDGIAKKWMRELENQSKKEKAGRTDTEIDW